jgi:hypothetical protein
MDLPEVIIINITSRKVSGLLCHSPLIVVPSDGPPTPAHGYTIG